ncbi:MAG: YegS/Rv2252/BmrU family lipid kinase [wastewater metagenome]|nr:YegS/Rv2252/BmrU family lipid kinase [Candidatus Loosdrechtia aerotolerans]
MFEKLIKEEKSVVLIVNAHSRKGERLYSQAMDMLDKRGVLLAASYSVQDPMRIPEVVKEAIGRGCKLIIVGGGDGTISSVIDYLACQNIVLGILPLGTGNYFAKTLEIPSDLDSAVDVIVRGKIVHIDLGKVNDDYFANVSSIGLTTMVARKISRHLKKYLGRVAYGIVGVQCSFTFRPFDCHFIAQEKNITIKTHQVVIANGCFQGGGLVAPETRLDNHKLAVFTMGEYSRWQLLKTWTAFFLGKHTLLSESNYFSTHEVFVKTNPPQYVDIDGEVTVQTPAHFSIARDALKVIVPSEYKEQVE